MRILWIALNTSWIETGHKVQENVMHSLKMQVVDSNSEDRFLYRKHSPWKWLHPRSHLNGNNSLMVMAWRRWSHHQAGWKGTNWGCLNWGSATRWGFILMKPGFPGYTCSSMKDPEQWSLRKGQTSGLPGLASSLLFIVPGLRGLWVWHSVPHRLNFSLLVYWEGGGWDPVRNWVSPPSFPINWQMVRCGGDHSEVGLQDRPSIIQSQKCQTLCQSFQDIISGPQSIKPFWWQRHPGICSLLKSHFIIVTEERGVLRSD